jgi:hypothetical protein
VCVYVCACVCVCVCVCVCDTRAVKIQYPNAERVMRSDLTNLRTLSEYLRRFEVPTHAPRTRARTHEHMDTYVCA